MEYDTWRDGFGDTHYAFTTTVILTQVCQGKNTFPLVSRSTPRRRSDQNVGFHSFTHSEKITHDECYLILDTIQPGVVLGQFDFVRIDVDRDYLNGNISISTSIKQNVINIIYYILIPDLQTIASCIRLPPAPQNGSIPTLKTQPSAIYWLMISGQTE